jgi:cell division transport system permease protein
VHFFTLREAMRSFRHHRGLGFTAILSLTAALVLCGLFLLLAWNAEVALRLIGDRREMVVYLNDGVSTSARESLMARLRELFGSVTYVSKDEAWEEFGRQIGDPSLLEAVDQNPLPASLRVHLRPELLHYDAMEDAARQVSQFPEVEDVRYGAEWVQRLDQIGTALRRMAIGIGIAVTVAILIVIYNTIRLSVLARRRQVEIMSRLGATDGFIARPFVLEAMLEAGVAALLALALLFGIQQAANLRLTDLRFLPLPWAGAFVGATLLLAWGAASTALSRVLRAVGP